MNSCNALYPDYHEGRLQGSNPGEMTARNNLLYPDYLVFPPEGSNRALDLARYRWHGPDYPASHL
ncbi:hypothetical protein FHX15_006230 [Rhizobium sp. BK650]|uniref:hypothetical protein n=1 Tax=Rhizobium sp. BK650 TaxID=2586990 RepID=UPI00160EAE70|nr:hypothetical protein [Rhizobium sp. BK650]MBB3660958.1 hypothetical protein [Rhizobium sp. BK650]